MRTHYVILLGLILFQGVFIALSSVFPYTPLQDTMPEDEYDQYNITDAGGFGGILGNIFIGWDIGIGGTIAAIGLIVALTSKNYVYLGVGLFVGILSTLYISTWNILTPLNITSNPLISSVIAILAIAIGLLALFSIVDMFAPQGAQQ